MLRPQALPRTHTMTRSFFSHADIQAGTQTDRQTHDDKDEGPEPNPLLEAGSKLPAKLAGEFPPELYGKPIEDLDDFYQNKHVSVPCILFDFCRF